MLSGRLIQLLETHQEQVTANVIGEIRHHPDMSNFRKLPDAELRERAQTILEHLGHWLSDGHKVEMEQRYESLGRERYEDSIPLDESVRALTITKEKMIDFVHEHGFAKTSMDLYAEEEFERRIGRFFDTLTIHMVRGYETACRQAAQIAV
jgi:hypothetical protein